VGHTLRDLVNNQEVSNKSYVWCGSEICEERVFGPAVKRFFRQGVKIETGAAPGRYFYTRDHLGSVRELIDGAGSVRARFDFDPFGSRKRIDGDLDVDFGFTGHLFHSLTSLCLAEYRAYDPKLGRWLSRDPLQNAEFEEGNSLFTYVRNNPANLTDRLGLCCEAESIKLRGAQRDEDEAEKYYAIGLLGAAATAGLICASTGGLACAVAVIAAGTAVAKLFSDIEKAQNAEQVAAELLSDCLRKGCSPCLP
jgi:RHS repeat-associated protein